LSNIFADYKANDNTEENMPELTEEPAEAERPVDNEESIEEPAEAEKTVEEPVETEKPAEITDPVPTYKSGETEIELPAATTDNTDIPEITSAEAEDPKLLDTENTEDDEDIIDFDKKLNNVYNSNNEEDDDNNEDNEEDDTVSESVTLNEARMALQKMRREFRRNDIVSITESKKHTGMKYNGKRR